MGDVDRGCGGGGGRGGGNRDASHVRGRPLCWRRGNNFIRPRYSRHAIIFVRRGASMRRAHATR
jgi:hypothetical protein